MLQLAEMVRQGYIGQPLAFNHVYFVSNYIVPRPGHRLDEAPGLGQAPREDRR